jgi:hypothetical protein
MIRIDARRVIATMKHTKALGNRAVGKLPCYAVGTPENTCIPPYPVTLIILALGPDPTISGSVR